MCVQRFKLYVFLQWYVHVCRRIMIMWCIIFILQRYYMSTNHSVSVYSNTVCVCVCVQRFKLYVFFTVVCMYAHAVLPMRYCPCSIPPCVLHHVFYTTPWCGMNKTFGVVFTLVFFRLSLSLYIYIYISSVSNPYTLISYKVNGQVTWNVTW